MNKLTDGCVTLRPLKTTDAKRMTELANNINISRNVRDAFPHPYTLEHAEQFIALCMKHDL